MGRNDVVRRAVPKGWFDRATPTIARRVAGPGPYLGAFLFQQAGFNLKITFGYLSPEAV